MASSDKSQPVHSPSKMSLESVGNMDMTKAGRGIWLVKVPKYLGDKWKECADSEVGTAYLTKVPGKLAKVTFVPNEHTLGNCKSALEYVFAQRDNENLTLGVFSEYICVLSASPDYIQLKKDLTVKDGQDRLKTKTIDSPANTSMSRAHKRNRYLQKILKKIGIYNIEGPFKRMWQLKPEYCCY
nr:general transcription factor IIF subunit 2-like isoform X2 [Procambarus clarkii]